MPRSGAISGHIVDEFGDPAELATVTAQRLVRTESGTASTVTTASTTTDDLGEYYLGGLPAGTFLVRATLQSLQIMNTVMMRGDVTVGDGPQIAARGDSPARAYYPGGSTLSQAQPLTVRAGEERSATDFIVAPVATAKLTLKFVDANGNLVDARATVASTDESTSGAATRPLMMMGANMSTNLEPGQWAIYARGAPAVGDRLGPLLVGMARVSLAAGDDMIVTVPMTKGAHITGKVIADGGPLPPRTDMRVEARPLDPALANAAGFASVALVRPDGAFDLSGIIGRSELHVIYPGRGWATRAILHEGRNLLESPIDFKGGEELAGVQVVLTSRTSQLTGTVIDSTKAPVKDYSVLVFPDDAALAWNLRRLANWVRPNQNGLFTVDDLPAGTYLAIAVDDVDADQWPNAAYVNQLRGRATRVTLGNVETKTITLELVTTR
jgi:hypothetical protein